jgi:hypothetical protein
MSTPFAGEVDRCLDVLLSVNYPGLRAKRGTVGKSAVHSHSTD